MRSRYPAPGVRSGRGERSASEPSPATPRLGFWIDMSDPREHSNADIACLIAKAERDYLTWAHAEKIKYTVVRGGEVVVLGGNRKPLARYKAHVTRFRIWITRIPA